MTDKPTFIVSHASARYLKFKADCIQAVQSLAAHLSVNPVALAEQLEKGGLVELFEAAGDARRDEVYWLARLAAILDHLRSVGGGDG